MTADALALVAAMDGLYEGVVSDPGRWSEAELAAWAADLHDDVGVLPKAWAREVRRVVRLAAKLARRLLDARAPSDGDWRGAVDAVLGGRGWGPSLEIARLGLASAPSPELFDTVRERFRVAHFTPWMEGVTYDEWLDGHRSTPSGA